MAICYVQRVAYFATCTCIHVSVSRSKVRPVEVRTASAVAKLNSYQRTNKAQEKAHAHTDTYPYIHAQVSKAQWPDKQCTQKTVAF